MAFYRTRPALDRFMEKVMPVPEAGCWIWVGATKPAGYGNFYMEGGHVNAHRASYEMHVGPVPDGAVVCHKCDTPSCVNPDHLFADSQCANLADMLRKGRHKPKRQAGELNGSAKLTFTDVAHIRASSEPTQALANRYGVRYQCIWQIRKGHSWKEAA